MDIIKFWTALVRLVFKFVNSSLSGSTPRNKTSSLSFWFNLGTFGTQCSIRLKSFWRSSQYKKHWRKKCSGDSNFEWQEHSGLSTWPIVNLCWFKSDLPTRIWVKSLFVNLFPREKCLYLGGFICVLTDILKSYTSLCWICCGKLFHNFKVLAKNEVLN